MRANRVTRLTPNRMGRALEKKKLEKKKANKTKWTKKKHGRKKVQKLKRRTSKNHKFEIDEKIGHEA